MPAATRPPGTASMVAVHEIDGYDEQLEAHARGLLAQLTSPTPASWPAKQQLLQQLEPIITQHPREAQEAILCTGSSAVLDSILSIMVSERTVLPSKLQAADVLSAMCTGDSKALLTLCPSSIVERLMRCAYKGDADVKAAAARALWQLSCHQDFSPEVVSHAGNAFKVVELLAEDMTQGSSSTCMCALRATQNLLHTYATSSAGDAGDRIGGRVVEPLCNLLEPNQPEAAAAAAELLALLSQSASNRARIVAAGCIPRLVALMRQASSSSMSSIAAPAGLQQDQQQHSQAASNAAALQESAAQASLQALAQLARGDAKLCLELLGAHIMPGLLQLLHHRGCCAGALSLIGDLATLPEGRRALHYADGFAALSEVAQACPEQQVCRLLSKATKGTSGSSGSGPSGSGWQDLSGLMDSPSLLAVLVRGCSPADRKTRKRAMQVLARLLEHSREVPGKGQQLQHQLLALGLLQQIQAVLSVPQKPGSQTGHTGSSSVAGQAGSSSSSSQGTVLEVQLAVALLHELSSCPEILTSASAAGLSSKVAALAALGQQQQCDHQPLQDQCSSKQVSQLSAALGEQATPFPAAAAAAAILASPSFVWKHPAASAAAFGDMSRLVPDIHATSGQQQQQQVVLDPTLPNLLWLLQQLLLSPGHHLPSLQQQVLQVVSGIAGHRHAGLLQVMVQQGWVQVLWSFLPGGRQLLAVTLSQLVQQQQQQDNGPETEQRGSSALGEAAAAAGAQVPSSSAAAAAVSHQRRLSSSGGGSANKRGSNLQPHLLQLLDENLPSVEHTLHALAALAHLCSCPAAAAVAAQLQASYQAAAAGGMLTVRGGHATAYHSGHLGQASVSATPTAAAAGAGASGHNAAAAVAAMLFGSSTGGTGGTASPRAGSGPRAVPQVGQPLSQPQSPRNLPATALSFASSSSSGSGSSMAGSYVAVAVPPVSSSLGTSSGILSSGGSSGIVKSSSTGLLSRLTGRGGGSTSNSQQRSQQAAAPAAAAAAGAGKDSSGTGSKGLAAVGAGAGFDATAAAGPAGGAGAGAAKPSAAAAAGEPVEDPGSPIQMLVTLLGEQWAATAAAELLAHLAAASPATCLPAMLEQGVAATLAECMSEIQGNSAGAVAALATLQLVQQLGSCCPEQLHAAGIVGIVLRMLEFDGGAAAGAVRAAALQVLAVLCGIGDRQLCGTVAQAVLLPLVRWLGSSANQQGAAAAQPTAAAAAATVLTALLDCGVVDGAALAALEGHEKISELLSLCLSCLPGPQQQQQSVGVAAGLGGSSKRQLQMQLTAVRLLRAFVELDARLVDAFLAADGLPKLVSMLSAAVAAAAAEGQAGRSSSSDQAVAGVAAEVSAAAEPHRQLVMQYEMLAILDSLSLCHRRVLVKASIIPIIVGILRQTPRQQQQGAAGSSSHAAAAAVAATAAGGSTGAEAAGDAGFKAASGSNAAGTSSSSSALARSRSLSRSSSKAPGAAAGLSAAAMSEGELLLRCKVIACNLITVLAINNDVKRQLFHSDAVGPLMQLAEAVGEGSSTQEAIRAALAQLGLVYLMPAAAAAVV